MWFMLFRYCLIPVVFYCVVVFASGIIATNEVQKSSWPQTTATVTQSEDLGEAFAEFRGTENDFPDPYGTLQYVVNGETHSWQGRGRDIGLTAMTQGDKITLYYNPANPQELSTLVLGASTGSIILAVAFAFLAFYVWFFWLRGLLRGSGPDDFGGDASFEGPAPGWTPSRSEGARFTLGDRGAAGQRSRPSFGKR
jgi:Protein of unknown function (DUF3592)